MKIVAIVGSPHKGNSLEVTQRIERKLTQYGDVAFETVDLRRVDLQPCRGCFGCFITGDDWCPAKDDKQTIARKLEEADGVIFVSPVYSMHVSYLFKRFVDRFACTFHRPRFFGKYAIVVAVAGNIGLKETNRYLKDVATAWGFEVLGELGYLMAPRNTPLRIIGTQKDRTDEVLAKFYRTIKEKPPRKLTFRDHLTFRIMQASYARLETLSPKDYEYWKEQGWLEPETVYFHDHIRANWLYDRATRAMGWLTGRQIDKALANSPS
jgi:multimeric flavodoxin WrbA